MMRTAAKRGTKRTCNNDDCGRRFYDLNKLPTDCPYCGAIFAAPPKAEIDTRTPRPRANFKSYRLQQEPDEPSPAVSESDDALIEADKDDAPESGADDIPEIDDEDIDETLTVDIKDRGEA